ncbi:hypothetical protein BC943DRAFT_329696 [Umbelopsis sp. AD052]|nr:hypothetical protein BC943DRAFT_329696 [Umbelopsis sp. AD052]
MSLAPYIYSNRFCCGYWRKWTMIRLCITRTPTSVAYLPVAKYAVGWQHLLNRVQFDTTNRHN